MFRLSNLLFLLLISCNLTYNYDDNLEKPEGIVNNKGCWAVVEIPDLRCRKLEYYSFSYRTHVDLAECAYDNYTLHGKFVDRIFFATNVIKVKCNPYDKE